MRAMDLDANILAPDEAAAAAAADVAAAGRRLFLSCLSAFPDS